MYWLLDPAHQASIRQDIDTLVSNLATIVGNPHDDQLFPYVGRKDRRKASAVIETLTREQEVVIDPFAGSGSFIYSAELLNRRILANEWEPYTNRMASAAWRVPEESVLTQAISALLEAVQGNFNLLYKTICPCGRKHVLDSQFFDRVPLRYSGVTQHERLGENGETITYRGHYRCPECRRTVKFFDHSDQQHMQILDGTPLPRGCQSIFSTPLIENSRINLSSDFTIYGNLFPKRSQLALCELWAAISRIECGPTTRLFLQDAFLSILPQAKYKDYRSKSQDLHCPEVQLREVNLLYRFLDQCKARFRGLQSFGFRTRDNPIECQDFRDFMHQIPSESVDLIFTDPPWTDGNAYFEKAQLYHPWMNYSLSADAERLEKEFVITDAPSRRQVHNKARWWQDIQQFFVESDRILEPLRYFALFFRPIPASKWLENINGLKLAARKAGFEPLLSIDVSGSDPSMRIQQSASYVFSEDIVFIFIKLPHDVRRYYVDDFDIDQLVFECAEQLQEVQCGPFSEHDWRARLAGMLNEKGLGRLNLPSEEGRLHQLFIRYCDDMGGGRYLPKALTPFSGQLFDLPAIERLFAYIPSVVAELTHNGRTFSYDRFLLKLAEYVENGTRVLIDQIQQVDLKRMLSQYAERVRGTEFRKRPLPRLPQGMRNVLELDANAFETFIANLLSRQGFTSVTVMGRSGDRGVDVSAIDPDGKSTVIQCKRYFQNRVNATPVQRLHSFSVTRGAERRILITTSSFTRDARHEARLTQTELIDGRALETLIAQHVPEMIQENSQR